MENQRKFWVDQLAKICRPVLASAADNSLKRKLATYTENPCAPLEAFGRTFAGIAPWLELTTITDPAERKLQAEFRELVKQGLANISDPASPGHLPFSAAESNSDQPLVDSAFLVHGLLRSPEQITEGLSLEVRDNLRHQLQKTRSIIHHDNNWILFSGMVEAGLALLGAEADLMRIDYAYNLMDSWYLGDGIYGDGKEYTQDYYNSFVIHPMLVDLHKLYPVIATNAKPHDLVLTEKVMRRATRCAQILEMQINADGTFPVFGRSMCYRFGCFQLLSQAALQHFLPANIQPSQVRAGLTAVIKKITENPAMFDATGWLTIGVYGEQPKMGEPYINVGSCYLCSTVFLPLGLAESDPFWSEPDQAWTAKQVWSGTATLRDQAYHEA